MLVVCDALVGLGWLVELISLFLQFLLMGTCGAHVGSLKALFPLMPAHFTWGMELSWTVNCLGAWALPA